MGRHTVPANAGEMKIKARVYRADTDTWEELGVVSYWHERFYRRWWWALTHRVRRLTGR